MTLDRPYRRAMSTSEAFAELARHRGTQFDSDVVDAMLGLERARISAAA
jgi:HD-GYP domain-containing protein (c-di-GMP phosphodiesterase class II)